MRAYSENSAGLISRRHLLLTATNDDSNVSIIMSVYL